ncbi:MAG: TaqI-like C-terminal specificity domain-containing protein, partial [Pseudomonadota bacterium]|nr:TaqI-like C-terminal specificity domain-containing protein [Pseudomonadota bacterium]
GKTLPEDLSAEFARNAGIMYQGQLSDTSWRLEDERLAALRGKLTEGYPNLKEVYGSPLYGIKTGLNAAFVIDRRTRDRLITEDPKSAELIKPFFFGKDLKKWRIEPRGFWFIYIPKNQIDIADYPVIGAHLVPFRKKLESRATKQAWFELQQPQFAYKPSFDKAKIAYVDIASKPNFLFDETASYYDTTAFIIPSDSHYLAGIVELDSMLVLLEGGESNTSWWFYTSQNTVCRKDSYPGRQRKQSVSNIATGRKVPIHRETELRTAKQLPPPHSRPLPAGAGGEAEQEAAGVVATRLCCFSARD